MRFGFGLFIVVGLLGLLFWPWLLIFAGMILVVIISGLISNKGRR
jgi:hypothetical protein